MASARKPTVKSNLRMGLFSRALARLCNGCESGALASPRQGHGRRLRGQRCQVSPGTKKPRTMPGLFVLLNLGRRSVPRGGRATQVEAIDEFGGGGLNVSVSTIEGVERTPRTAPTYYSSSTDLRRGVISVVSEAIFTFPEQTREPIKRVLRAAAKEVAIQALARPHKARSHASRIVKIVDLFEIGLCPTTVEISEQSRKGDVADTTTSSPRPIIFYLTDKTAWAGTQARSAETIIDLDVRPLTIDKRANHNA